METAAVYCRVSTLAQSKEGVSLEAQMETCKRWAVAQGVEIYKPDGQDAYVDVISGVKKDRPALSQLIEDARSRRFNRVICMRLDRLGRSLKDLIELYTLFETDLRIQLIFVKDNIDTSTPVGRLLRNVLGSVAEFERELIKDRTLSGKLKKLAEGKPVVFKRTLGYRYNKEKNVFELVPAEIDLYKRIIHMVLEERMSLSRIALKLKQEKVRGLLGGTFNTGSLGETIRNPIYRGVFVANRRTPSQSKAFKAPAVIDDGTWQRLQDSFETRKYDKVFKRRENLDPDPNHRWLPGEYFGENINLRCGLSGHKVRAKINKSRKSWNKFYLCGYRALTAAKKLLDSNGEIINCKLPLAAAWELDSTLWKEAKHLLLKQPEEVFQHYAKAYRSGQKLKDLTSKKEELEKELGALAKKKDRLLHLYLDDKRNIGEFEQAEHEINTDMDRIRAQIQRLDSELAGAREVETELTWLEKYAHMIPDIATLVFEELNGCDGEHQKRIITSLLSKAVVKVYDPRTVKVEGVINYQGALVVLAEISKERDKIFGMIEDMQKKIARDKDIQNSMLHGDKAFRKRGSPKKVESSLV